MCWFDDRPTSRRQNPESDGNGKTTLEKGGRNPPDVTLDHVADDLLKFKGFQYLNKTEKNIEKKYDIKKEHGNCWPADDIKRAWGKTQRMNKMEREKWATVIILQILKRSLAQSDLKENLVQSCEELCLTDTPDRMKAKKENVGPKAEDGLCSTDRPAERSYQSNAEQKTAGADEQLFGAGLKPSQCKLTEESGPASESQLSTPSTDVASSSTELGGRNVDVLVNENEDALVDNCEQQKNIGYYKLRVADDKENERWVDGLQSTVDIKEACGKAQRMKGNSKDRSSQSNDVLETMGPAGGVKQHSGANPTTYGYYGQTYSVSQSRTETSFPFCNYSSYHFVASVIENMPRADETICIRIPLTEMFRSEQRVRQEEVPNVESRYKLIDGAPSDVGLRKRKSYAMSFNNETGNARWVYEILNRETSVNNCVQAGFGDPYDRGHLAAAANHRWCREALNDANLNSNIISQHKILNRGPWKMLENWCRDLRDQTGVHNVHVFSGPLYIENKSGHTNYGRIGDKVVPTHFFKVIIVENNDGTVREPECYLMPNTTPPHLELEHYIVDIEYIQYVSGLTFIERRHNVRQRDRKIMAGLQGEDVNEMPQIVQIGVRLSQ